MTTPTMPCGCRTPTRFGNHLNPATFADHADWCVGPAVPIARGIRPDLYEDIDLKVIDDPAIRDHFRALARRRNRRTQIH